MDVNGIYFSDKLITYFKRVSSDTSNAIKVGLKDFILFNFFFPFGHKHLRFCSLLISGNPHFTFCTVHLALCIPYMRSCQLIF